MTLREAVDRYVAWQRDHGARFRSSAETLDAFCRRIGVDRDCDTVGENEIRRFLAGKGALTRSRAVKYGTLAGFYGFALSRGHVSRIPMPPREAEPRPPEVAPSFIFTHEELRHLFRAAGGGRRRCLKLDVETFRTFLLLLYGAGLRSGEARRLTLADVDLDSAVLAVNRTKFYKSRLVPVGADLADELRRYAAIRTRRPLREGSASAFTRLPRRIAAEKGDRTSRLPCDASGGRNRHRQTRMPGALPAFAAPQLCHPPPDLLASRGGRRSNAPAGALDLSRPRQRGGHPGLHIDDPGLARRGRPPLRALRRTKPRPGCRAASERGRKPCLNATPLSAHGSSASSWSISRPSAIWRSIP